MENNNIVPENKADELEFVAIDKDEIGITQNAEPDENETDEAQSAESDENAVTQDEKPQERLTLAENIYEFASVMVTSMIAIAIIFTFFFRLVGVSGSSMNNTLQNGDWLIVATYYNEPKYKDIVIITQPNVLNESLVKRVIAVGGQTIDIDFETGHVYVGYGNELEPLDEDSYIAERIKGHSSDILEFPLVVPEGYVFVMGDNRNHSADSRSNKIGLIKEEYLLGRAAGRLIPFGSWSIYE